MIFHRILCICILSWLCACSSGSKKDKRMSQGERSLRNLSDVSLKRMQNPNDRSHFDKAMQASLSKKGSAAWFSRQKYGARDYNGVKSFSANEFKTQGFAEADHLSKMGEQSFSEKDKSPAFADDTFRTNQSPLADNTMRDSDKIFPGADAIFKTKADSRISKSAAKDNTPKFIELEGKERRSAYSEDQVRALMGRD